MKSYHGVRGLILLGVLAGSACDKEVAVGPLDAGSTDSLLIVGLPAIPTFSTFLGGNNQDQVRDVTMDAQGNVYVVGGTASSNFPTTAGVVDRSFNGTYDIFITKFSPSGQLLFSTYLGGPGYDRAYAVELDPQGNIVVAGRSGGGLPGTAGRFSPTFKGGKAVGGYGPQDGFVCKLTPSAGSVVFCGYIGTRDEYITRDVTVDAAGNIYAPYVADSTGIPASWTAGGYMPTYPGSSTNLVIKIAPDGSRVLGGTWFGGSGIEYGNPSVRWFNGRLYLVSRTTSPNLPTPGGFDHTLNGTWDIFLAVFADNLQTLNFATYVGGSGNEDTETHNLAVDGNGNAFIAASTPSTDLPGTAGRFQPVNRGNGDAFVMKISPSGALKGASYYGGSSGDMFQGVVVDAAGRVYMSTVSQSKTPPMTALPLGVIMNGSAGLVVMSPNLDSLLFAEFMGGSASDDARAIAIAPGGNVVLGGMTSSTNWYLKSSYQGGFGGGKLDGVVARFTGF